MILNNPFWPHPRFASPFGSGKTRIIAHGAYKFIQAGLKSHTQKPMNPGYLSHNKNYGCFWRKKTK